MFVVGLPTSMDGAEHELTRLARKFAQQSKAAARPVAFVDERLSSNEAEERLRDAGVAGKKQKPHLDPPLPHRPFLQSYFR